MPTIELWPHLWAYNDVLGWTPREGRREPTMPHICEHCYCKTIPAKVSLPVPHVKCCNCGHQKAQAASAPLPITPPYTWGLSGTIGAGCPMCHGNNPACSHVWAMSGAI